MEATERSADSRDRPAGRVGARLQVQVATVTAATAGVRSALAAVAALVIRVAAAATVLDLPEPEGTMTALKARPGY